MDEYVICEWLGFIESAADHLLTEICQMTLRLIENREAFILSNRKSRLQGLKSLEKQANFEGHFALCR